MADGGTDLAEAATTTASVVIKALRSIVICNVARQKSDFDGKIVCI